MSNQTLVPDSFEILLTGFKAAIDGYPEINKVSGELEELISTANNNVELTFWQKDAIISRCKNYLNGKYGAQVTKVDNRSDYSKNLK